MVESKYKHLYLGLLVIVGILLFVLITNISEKRKNYGKTICYTTHLNATTVYRKANRGTIVVNDSLFIWSDCEILDSSFCRKFGSNVDIGSQVVVKCSLSNLDTPYLIFKDGDSDTLFIVIGSDTSKCLIQHPCRDFRLNRYNGF